MSRFFAELAYKGTHFAGWQRQLNAPTIQEEIENKLSTVFNQKIAVVGCGRTDAGVHASQYFLHFDVDAAVPTDLTHRLNRMLSPDIVIRRIFSVADNLHARFNAVSRSYGYYLTKNKSPFDYELKTRLPQFDKIDRSLLVDCANLISTYDEFFPFCKTNSDAETMKCKILESHWEFHNAEYVYKIKANRFLRGMVRLIVGMSVRVAMGDIELNTVKIALDQQTALNKSWSAPAEGLFLEEINYP